MDITIHIQKTHQQKIQRHIESNKKVPTEGGLGLCDTFEASANENMVGFQKIQKQIELIVCF